MTVKTRTYTHIPLNEEVTAIGGYYVLEKEVRMPFHGEEVLYVVGMSLIDSSCCGVTGCKYAIVPGYILDWHVDANSDGLPITQVQPIRDQDTRNEIIDLVKRSDLVQHVEFN